MEFKYWCKKNDIFEDDIKKTTHLLLDGGKLKINEYNKFYKVYEKCMKKNIDTYVVERVSSIIKYFLDIDFKKVGRDETLLNNINECLPFNNKVYECTEKKGYHIIYQNETTTKENAKKMTEKLKEKLLKYGYDKDFLTNAIDTTVYNTGLRLIGSYKKNEHRCYVPIGKEREDITQEDIENSSIRTVYENEEKQQTNTKQISKLSTKKGEKQDETNFRYIKNDIIYMNKSYNELRITKLEKIQKCTIINTDSKYCQNIKDNHKNANVYFVITPGRRLYQRCYCKCDTTEGREEGKCKSYKSKYINLSLRANHEITTYFQK